MGPAGLVFGNVLLTVWIAGGFIALLFLTRKELQVASQDAAGSLQSRQEIDIPGAHRDIPTLITTARGSDVIWERRPRKDSFRRREAA